jgi:hypothetical protein
MFAQYAASYIIEVMKKTRVYVKDVSVATEKKYY